jgi:SpoVK/Ycf46/Vps4 family AAA+-type ATPase
LGVKMPNGLLLSGPPGCGKTFAMKKLAAFLAWNTVEVTLGSIGSSYMHQTTKQIRRLFEQAEVKRPSLLVMNEIDALAAQRGPTSHDYKVEEVNEFLTLLETAAERGILVGATTNRIESIDNAFLRKGRFDLQVRMGYPDQAQASGMLAALLQERPHVQGLNLEAAATQLAGSPASDFDWAVNEAARLAARAGKDQIDDICLFEAINRLKAPKR